MWGYGFLVSPAQNRVTRFTDATGTNPTITNDVQADAEQARDLAFAYIDDVGMPAPYQILASGNRSGDDTTYSLSVTVVRQSNGDD
jgi:hypothetical protein